MLRKIASVCLLASLAVLALAARGDAKELEKGSAFLSIMLSQGDADLIGPVEFSLDGTVAAYDHSEWGGQLQYQYLYNEHWAFSPSVGIGTFNETDEPGPNSTPGTTDFEYSQSSFNVRLGLDRFVSIGEGVCLYMGPGFSFWSGKAKFVQDPSLDSETEDVTRLALDGRLGGHIALGETFGITGYIGHYVGHASGEDDGAKATWTPSGMVAGMGASFQF